MVGYLLCAAIVPPLGFDRNHAPPSSSTLLQRGGALGDEEARGAREGKAPRRAMAKGGEEGGAAVPSLVPHTHVELFSIPCADFCPSTLSL